MKILAALLFAFFAHSAAADEWAEQRLSECAQQSAAAGEINGEIDKRLRGLEKKKRQIYRLRDQLQTARSNRRSLLSDLNELERSHNRDVERNRRAGERLDALITVLEGCYQDLQPIYRRLGHARPCDNNDSSICNDYRKMFRLSPYATAKEACDDRFGVTRNEIFIKNVSIGKRTKKTVPPALMGAIGPHYDKDKGVCSFHAIYRIDTERMVPVIMEAIKENGLTQDEIRRIRMDPKSTRKAFKSFFTFYFHKYYYHIDIPGFNTKVSLRFDKTYKPFSFNPFEGRQRGGGRAN